MKKLFMSLIFLFVVVNSSEALPSRYDLRDYGRVTSVKNQGIPGPCWAFAAVGAMESSYLTQKLNTNNKIPDLSEMQLAFFCYRGLRREKIFSSEHKNGILSLEGNVFMPVAFMSRLSGPVDDKFLRYATNLSSTEKNNLAKKLPENFRRSTMRLRDAYFLSGTRTLSENERKNLIMKHGAIVISMYSEIGKYHTKGKYYTYYNPAHGKEINHLVLIAGWDDNFSAENFSPRPSRNGAWLIKNSWGTMRGSNGGYFWLSYDQHTYGGTAFIVEKNNPRLKHYGYDDLGWCGNVKYSWGANVFKVDDYNEKLKEIAFYAPSDNTNYEIYVYDLGTKFSGSPISDKLISTSKGTKKLTGYYTIKLPEEISLSKGKYFSAVVNLKRNDFAVETKVNNYSENFLMHEKESYFSRDGKKWIDGIKINANACIKAFTVTPNLR